MGALVVFFLMIGYTFNKLKSYSIMAKGTINVTANNIFPIIKKFLYSDHEIFLRELISNATDATLKLKHLSSLGETKGDVDDLKIEVKIDDDKKTLHIIDKGIGMTKEEVEKYIAEVAFSGAEEFVEKYKDKIEDTGIIGHFGLGFYSAFMVSKKVEILSKSYNDQDAVHWQCEGDPEYTIEKSDKKTRGTEVILHIDEDSQEFLKQQRISELLLKYNKFMPIPIKFGTREETIPKGEDGKEEPKGEDGKEDPKSEAVKEEPKSEAVKEDPKSEAVKEEKITVDNIINNSNPAWTKKPTELKEEDYRAFYRELYPMQFEEPLFQIHLNVDHPFNLTGILYFPKVKTNIDIQKDKIQLYQNQVFVTDNVEGVVPEFLTFLRGVIDSPDIPLNVSRSYLQADGAVKKISGYITKKVADKLSSLFKKDRKAYQEKWDDIKMIIEYGMLTEEKFFEKADKFMLYPTVDGEFFTKDEIINKVKDNQTDKDKNLVLLYAADNKAQHSYIEAAKEKGYQVLILNSPIVSHLLQKLETSNEKLKFTRVDSDHIDNLIKKEETTISKLSDKEKEEIKSVIEKNVPSKDYTLQMEALDSQISPFVITVPEFMRRMKEMNATGGGGMFGMGNMPEMYNLTINTNHELIGKILEAKTEKRKSRLISQALDLARLSQNLLHGKELTEFIKRSYQLIK